MISRIDRIGEDDTTNISGFKKVFKMKEMKLHAVFNHGYYNKKIRVPGTGPIHDASKTKVLAALPVVFFPGMKASSHRTHTTPMWAFSVTILPR